ncbi:MAG TPA: radical SAM protein [Candidatus Sabulitectum sp.]|nr:radical SAM protein [Candidatus Sabulitectum sp.]HPJ27911.1 radical SAM protein [Candidatus Sabulitectum sp.]HPR21860.1 radical SAM protein [Candidatus Sabulitectum sp.]
MKILFLVHDGLTVPLGVSYLAAIAEELGHEIGAVALTDRRMVQAAEDCRPDLLAFGSTTGFHRKYLEMVEPLAERLGVPVIMGGAHPTFFPEVMDENPWLDYAMRGEADTAFPLFLRALENRTPLSTVGNLMYRENGRVRMNPLLPLVQDLDSIPFPKRDLLPGGNRKAVFCITGRGCPYDCTYCFNHTYRDIYRNLGQQCRRRSVHNVISEIREVKEADDQLQMIVFQDDIFILDHEWVREFCRIYPEEIGLPFHCHLRANLVTEEITGLLAGAGCISVKMALENTNERILNEVLGRNLRVSTLEKACRLVKKSGIRLVTQNILGVPTSTLEDDIATLAFNHSIRPDFAFATLLQPYPKTRIAEFCRERNLIRNDQEIPDSFFDDTVLKIDDISKRKRLRHLFALSIEFKFLRPLLHVLLNLPLDGVYSFFDKLWKGYCIKQREFPYKLTFREYAGSVFSYLRSRYY